MKLFIILLSLLASQITFSQTKKKIVYFDSENQEITSNQFKSLDDRKVYVRESENDSTIIRTVVQRKSIGQLDSIQHSQITMLLTKIIGDEFDGNKDTMIHLYSNPSNLGRGINNVRYWQWIKNNTSRVQSFLMGTKDSGIQANPEKHLFIDEYNIFKNVFFKDSEFSINHIFIKSNGEIYIYYGGEDILGILDWSV